MIRLFAFIILLLSSHTALATCTGTTGVMTIDIGTVTVGSDSPNSTGTRYISGAGNSYANNTTLLDMDCTAPYTVTGHVTSPVPGTTNLEKVMLNNGTWSGLGYNFLLSTREGYYPSLNGLTPPDSTTVDDTHFCSSARCYNGHTDQILLGLVDVYGGNSPAVPGQINQRINGVFTADGTSAWDYIITGQVVVASCSVDASTPVTVDLGTVYSSSLPATGSTSNDTDFAIRLNCNANVNVTLTMNGDEDNDVTGQGILALQAPANGAAMAGGVGVQLLFNNAPLALNQQVSVGNATSGAFEIPLTARYYKTRDKLTTGEVYAAATYTLNYM